VKQLSCFILFLFFFGCNHHDHPFELSRIKSFPINDSLHLHSFNVEENLGYPNKIYCYDSIIALLDINDKHQVHLLSANTKEVLNKIITKGQGPNELIGAWHLTSMDGTGSFYVHDIVSRYIMGVNITNALYSEFKPFLKIHLRDELSMGDCAELLNDSTFVMSGRFDDCRIIKFNNDGKILEKIGVTPDINKKRRFDPILSESYQGKIKLKPDGSKYALACKFADQIEIFDCNGISQERFIVGPMFFSPVYKTVNRGGSSAMAIDREKSIEGYTSLAVSDNYIIGLFSGASLSGRQSGDSKILHVFDWDGNPVARYFLNQECLSIDIEANKLILYALTINPNVEVFSCSLNLP